VKVCLLNTIDHVGGAARACRRLYEGLLNSGVDANLLVREREAPGDSVAVCGSRFGGWLRAMLDELLLYRYPSRRNHNFSAAFMPAGAIKKAIEFNPDVLHLHWVPKGFVRIEDLQRITVPLVWTMHDFWPFTGGCHLPGDCNKYQESCGACPVLGSTEDNDLSRSVWKRKEASYPLDKMTIVAPSQWLAEQARSSSLFNRCGIEVIPNGLDTELYSPGNKYSARTSLKLPLERKIILFGGKSVLSDPNKGADLLWSALEALPLQIKKHSLVVVFGDEHNERPPPTDLDVLNYGIVDDESRVVDLYRASDVLAMTSRQENLPNMIAEGMSCGLPCVAFSVGGIPEQIRHRRNGCLVEPFDISAMSSEISWLLSYEGQQKSLAAQARDDAVGQYSMGKVSRQHIALYEKVVNSCQEP